jgi:hypothetical protein
LVSSLEAASRKKSASTVLTASNRALFSYRLALEGVKSRLGGWTFKKRIGAIGCVSGRCFHKHYIGLTISIDNQLAEWLYRPTSNSLALARYNAAVDLGRHSFFIKPHLGITQLRSHPIEITVGNGWDGTNNRPLNPEVFQGRIWTLVVRNNYPRITKYIRNCSFRLYWETIRGEVQHRWRLETAEPKVIQFGTRASPASFRDEYLTLLGYNYASRTLTGLREVDLPEGREEELYLLFTFEGSAFAFLVVPTQLTDVVQLQSNWHDGVFVSEYNHNPLFLRMGMEYGFRIRYDSAGYSEGKRRRYRLRLNSWDNIELGT